MLFAGDEPIARFLPPAKWTMPDRQQRGQDGSAPQVTYTIPDDIIKTASPLTTLPRAEIDAFSDAIAAFLAKARPDAKGVTPYMRQCRQEFRLPNPELDAEAYWVYGPEFDRRLLILWGCEPQGGASLTLEQVFEQLLAREMSWRDKQNLALKLALQPGEPIARFLARRTPEGGLQVGTATVPAKKLSRLKTIAPGEWRAFEEAARAYYAKAHPGGTTPPFERELRREFRLPSLEQVPGDFYSVGGRLAIALDTWPKEMCVTATDDPVLKMLEPSATPFAITAPAPVSSATLSAQLKARQQPPWVIYAKLAAAAAVVLGTGFGGWWALRPPPVPQFLEAQTLDDRTVVLTFSTPIAPATLLPRPAPGGGRADDPLAFFDDKLKIASRSVPSTAAPNKVMVQVDGRFTDGEKYGIAIKNLAPPKGRPIAPSNAEFTYHDRVAPKLLTPSAGGKSKKNLLLVFSKSIAENSLTPSRFAIYQMDGGQRGKRLNVVGAEFDKEDKAGATVMLEASDDFVGGKTYVLDITGVTDRAVKPNPVDEKSGMNREFSYKNVLPPRLTEVVATGGKFEIALTFNSPLELALARDEANYTLIDADKKPLRLLKGGIQVDDAGTTVTLRLEPQRLTAAQHQLTVARMADRQGNVTKAAIERSFGFNDAADRKPPALESVEGTIQKGSVTQEDRTLRLKFDRALDAESAADKSHFRVLDSDRRPIELQSVAAASDDPTRVVVQLARTIGRAGSYAVETSGLLNVFGVAQLSPATSAFEVKGGSITRPSLADWVQAPLLKSGGQLLVLSIRPRITEESARTLANYEIEPATVKIAKVESVDLGTDENRVTTVTLRLAAPAREATVAVQNLLLEGRKERGPQSLRPRATMFEP